MSNKTYILQKDLPNVKAGAEVVWNSTETWVGGPLKGGRYGIWPMPSDYSCDMIFTCEDVENNPEWFKLKEDEKIEVTKVYYISDSDEIDGGGVFGFKTSKQFHPSKFKLIQSAIENSLNDSSSFYSPLENVNSNELKLYTEKQLLEAEENAFNAGGAKGNVGIFRPNRSISDTWSFQTFSDYKNSQTK